MKKTVSSPLKALSVALAGLLLSVSVNAQTCDPQVAQAAAAHQKQILEQEAARSQDVYGGHAEQPDWLRDSDGMLTACMSNNWPALKVSQPVLQSLLSKAQEKATKAACNKARQAVSQATGKYTNMLKSIPGYSNIQNGNVDLGQWGDIGELGGTSLPGMTSGVQWGDIVNGGTSGIGDIVTGEVKDRVGNIPGITP